MCKVSNRREFARVRIVRLTDKINALEGQTRTEAVIKALRSSRQSLKRWKREFPEIIPTH